MTGYNSLNFSIIICNKMYCKILGENELKVRIPKSIDLTKIKYYLGDKEHFILALTRPMIIGDVTVLSFSEGHNPMANTLSYTIPGRLRKIDSNLGEIVSIDCPSDFCYEHTYNIFQLVTGEYEKTDSKRTEYTHTKEIVDGVNRITKTLDRLCIENDSNRLCSNHVMDFSIDKKIMAVTPSMLRIIDRDLTNIREIPAKDIFMEDAYLTSVDAYDDFVTVLGYTEFGPELGILAYDKTIARRKINIHNPEKVIILPYSEAKSYELLSKLSN